jgi:iron-sulfur cluster assembly protein
VVNYADEVLPDDRVFDSQGVRVVIDAESLGLIDGTEVDFVRHGLNEAFRFRNPNVRGECGCGESFSV